MDLDKLTQDVEFLKSLDFSGDDPWTMVLVIGTAALIGVSLTIKLAFMSMKKADKRRQDLNN